MSPSELRFQAPATFLNGGQAERELPHTARGVGGWWGVGGALATRLQGEPPSPPITSLGGAKRAIQFLKAAARPSSGPEVGGVGAHDAPEAASLSDFRIKARRHGSSKKVFSFSFLLNVKSHVKSTPAAIRAVGLCTK